MEIRAATDDDLAQIRDVFRRSSWSNESDRALLTEHPEYLEWEPVGSTAVADDAGRIVGFATVIDAGEHLELEDLFVDPDCTRRGIASTLIEHVGRDPRPLEVDANGAALEFYTAAGFVHIGVVEREHGPLDRMRRPSTLS